MGNVGVGRAADLNADLLGAALGASEGADETSVGIGNDEVIAEPFNGLVDIDGRGVAAHRLRAMLLTVCSDGVAVLSEVAERPVDGHFVAWRFSAASSASISMSI